MSIDLNWDALTSGPDGEALSESIRSFVHSKFQTVAFPSFIKSVHVHSFSFGSIPPDIEIRSILDPYPEFYEDEYDGSGSESEGVEEYDEASLLKLERERRRRERRNHEMISVEAASASSQPPPPYSFDGSKGPGGIRSFRGAFSPIPDSFPGRVGVPGVTTPLFNPLPSATTSSNLRYFHSALSSSFQPGSSSRNLSAFNPQQQTQITRSVTPASDPPSPPSTADSSRPRTGPTLGALPTTTITPPPNPPLSQQEPLQTPYSEDPAIQTRRSSVPLLREPRDDDTQILLRIRYSGDIRLELTAELLLEYPVTNFVALPVRLVITGCTFDGLACIAYIRRKAHFCFLDEDPAAHQEGEGGEGERRRRLTATAAAAGGGKSLLKEIRVESEIGEKGRGKQVLKNVGKVERFVLEQVRRIFEEEFVFPSSWTFLV